MRPRKPWCSATGSIVRTGCTTFPLEKSASDLSIAEITSCMRSRPLTALSSRFIPAIPPLPLSLRRQRSPDSMMPPAEPGRIPEDESPHTVSPHRTCCETRGRLELLVLVDSGDRGRPLREFLADLRSILGLGVLRRVGRKALEDDCPAIAAQVAYFVLLFLFPFLMLLVAVAGLAVDDPESVLETLAERMGGVVPDEAVGLLADYVDRTLRSRTSGVLLFAVLLALGSGSAAAQAIVKAANRAYDVRETRSFLKISGISLLMGLAVTLLVGALAFATFGPEIGGYVRG